MNNILDPYYSDKKLIVKCFANLYMINSVIYKYNNAIVYYKNKKWQMIVEHFLSSIILNYYN